ncbi:DNA-binding response regulator [Marinomonas sp. CT5]|uniref:response regulator transcription factor n=1 Tax=Marinomonas sp. CT5 TaxID=2066133 RepID=UPI001BAF390A|nr:response regulator [Marinomonas sp. CT5]QUX97161.1 DNA-binding response regulator [Marinomonas sp. CT5]
MNSIVYVIDDDESVRNSVSWLLNSVGIEVKCFESADLFLSEAEFIGVGCILLDVRMPKTGGLELQSEIEKLECTMPIIFLTAYGSVQMAVRALKKGAINFIEKPYDDQRLIDSVNSSLEKSKELYDNFLKKREIENIIKRLTDREKEIYHRIVEGKSSKAISQELFISIKTVETHRSNIREKIGSNSIMNFVREVWKSAP